MHDELGRRLIGSEQRLSDRYDTVMFDLDGVVYIGAEAVAGAPERMVAVRAAGMHPAFVTNNASRTPREVAAQLRDIGVRAEAADVVTSAQAAARMVRELVPADSAVLTVGGTGLVEALAEHGLRAVFTMDDEPVAVIQGFGREVGWCALAEAVSAVDAGLPWVASNLDATMPTPRGRAPGNGQLVDVVARTTGQRPRVAGKPGRALFDETLKRVGGERPIVVGDRLDTDIEGALGCGLPSLLVLTGVTDLVGLCGARSGARPTYVSSDLGGLLLVHPDVQVHAEGLDVTAACAGWTCEVTASDGPDPKVLLTGSGDDDDAVRTLVSACWAHLDAGGAPVAADMLETARRGPRP